MSFDLELTGTISDLTPDQVRVTWHQDERRKPRMRVWYDRVRAAKILVPTER